MRLRNQYRLVIDGCNLSSTEQPIFIVLPSKAINGLERRTKTMKAVKLKDLKKGEYFTRKPVEYPTEKQVLIKEDYCRDVRKYLVVHWNDCLSGGMLMKGDTIVYTDFIF